jgi:hypothetical protein
MYRPENFQKNFLVCIKPALFPELVFKRKKSTVHAGIRQTIGGYVCTIPAGTGHRKRRENGRVAINVVRSRRRRGGMSWIFTPAKECNNNFSGVFCLPVFVVTSTVTFSSHDPYAADSAGYWYFFAEKNG